MSQIPEDLLQQIMKMTGKSRSEVENLLSKSIFEMANGSSHNAQTPEQSGERGNKPKYDVMNYPRFLPSDNVRKYTLRVSLKGAPVPVWRKFECPSNISLRYLTELLLQLMGWENEHLNQIVGPHDTCYVPCYQHSNNFGFGDDSYQEEYAIADILYVKGKSIKWEYDFGDSWSHELRLSSIDDYTGDDSPKIVFLSGKGACPPEDCGGVWGYQELLELHLKRKARKRLTSEEKERLEWYDIYNDYDPEYCDVDFCMEICEDFTDGMKKKR